MYYYAPQCYLQGVWITDEEGNYVSPSWALDPENPRNRLKRYVRKIRPDGTALCNHCDQWKPLDTFNVRSGKRPLDRYVFVLGRWFDQPSTYCKRCTNCKQKLERFNALHETQRECSCKADALLRAVFDIAD